MPRGPAALMLAILVAANACGAAPPPAARGDVQRGTALPPPGLGAAAASR